jgi:hypothetical protein
LNLEGFHAHLFPGFHLDGFFPRPLLLPFHRVKRVVFARQVHDRGVGGVIGRFRKTGQVHLGHVLILWLGRLGQLFQRLFFLLAFAIKIINGARQEDEGQD